MLEIRHVCLLCLGWKPPWPKWKGTNSFMSQRNLAVKATKTYFSCFKEGVLRRRAQTHKHKPQRIQGGFSSFSLCWFVYTGLLHHLCVLTERDGLWGEKGWKFSGCQQFAPSVCVCVCENSLFSVHGVQPHFAIKDDHDFQVTAPVCFFNLFCFSLVKLEWKMTDWIILSLFPQMVCMINIVLNNFFSVSFWLYSL